MRCSSAAAASSLGAALSAVEQVVELRLSVRRPRLRQGGAGARRNSRSARGKHFMAPRLRRARLCRVKSIRRQRGPASALGPRRSPPAPARPPSSPAARRCAPSAARRRPAGSGSRCCRRRSGRAWCVRMLSSLRVAQPRRRSPAAAGCRCRPSRSRDAPSAGSTTVNPALRSSAFGCGGDLLAVLQAAGGMVGDGQAGLLAASAHSRAGSGTRETSSASAGHALGLPRRSGSVRNMKP